MSELKTRSLTAFFIAIVSIGAVLGGPYTFAFFILAIGFGINHEVFRLFIIDQVSLSQNLIFGLLTTTPLLLAFLKHFGWIDFSIAAIFQSLPLLLLLIYFIFMKSGVTTQSNILAAAAFSILYISVGLMSTLFLGWPTGEYTFVIILSIIVLIWTNDSFAYFTGSKVGKTPLAKIISPKKTWEGSIGGGLFTVLVAIAIYYITHLYSLWVWIGIGILVAIFSNIGDLLQSALKRAAGVKDSGNILPGHGGIFDRYDSFVCVLPVIYLYLIIVL